MRSRRGEKDDGGTSSSDESGDNKGTIRDGSCGVYRTHICTSPDLGFRMISLAFPVLPEMDIALS